MALQSSRSKRIIVAIFAIAILSLQTVSAEGFTRKDAIREAQNINGGGKVLGVRESKKNGKSVYSIKLINNGKVRVIKVPAR